MEFLVKADIKDQKKEIKGISDRVVVMKIEVRETVITFIQIYAPTSAADEETTEQFYDEVNETIHEYRSLHNNLIIVGDWNSQVGLREMWEKNVLGDYNDRGWRLIRFGQEHNLKVMNSFFKKKVYKKWSWITPHQEHKT